MEQALTHFAKANGRCPMRISTLAIAAVVLFVVSVPLYAGQIATEQVLDVQEQILNLPQHAKV